MNKQELVARCAVLLIIVAFPVSVFAYQYVYLPTTDGEAQAIDLVARAPEAGGWSPEIITVEKGDTVQLRITGHDVVHGFAIGGLGIDVGQIIPGEATTVEFVVDEVGRFTYYCNVWCSPYHYRMRGTLEVVDPAAPDAPLVAEEEYQFTGLDIDSPHEAAGFPTSQPSVARGQTLAEQIELPTLGNLRKQSPSDVFQAIRDGEAAASLRRRSGRALSDEEIWDLVGYLWFTATTTERLSAGEALYAKNCVGCHGLAGGGDGPGRRHLDEPPTDFTDARTMTGGGSEIYYAKTQRGGMGTGMPYWGTIFSEEEIWSIVEYLWTFLFKDAKTEQPGGAGL